MNPVENSNISEKSRVVLAVRKVAGVITGVCTTKLVVDILDNVSPTPLAPLTKVAYGFGSYIIGDMIGEKACEHVENKVTESAECILFAKAILGNFNELVDLTTDNAND